MGRLPVDCGSGDKAGTYAAIADGLRPHAQLLLEHNVDLYVPSCLKSGLAMKRVELFARIWTG